jgi:hypothetical protein
VQEQFRFSIEPGVGIGPVRFRMSKDQVSRLFTFVYRSFFKTPASRHRSDQIEVVGLIVHYDAEAAVEYIEAIARPQYAEVTLLLYGEDVTRATVARVVSIVAPRSPSTVKDPNGYTFPDLGLNTYNHLLESDQDLVEAFGLERPEHRVHSLSPGV